MLVIHWFFDKSNSANATLRHDSMLKDMRHPLIHIRAILMRNVRQSVLSKSKDMPNEEDIGHTR